MKINTLTMKKSLLIAVFFVGFFAQAQLSENSTFAYERTAFTRWDEFKPKWLFFFMKKYKDEDQRTMYARAKQMSEWAIYMDHYKNFEHQTDSVYKAEQYKAIDRTINKTWLLVQKPKVNKLKEQIDKALETSLDVVKSVSLVENFNSYYDTSLEKIDITLDAYVSDAKKEEKINDIIKQLGTLLNIITAVNIIDKYEFEETDNEIDFSILLEQLEEDYNQIFPLEIK